MPLSSILFLILVIRTICEMMAAKRLTAQVRPQKVSSGTNTAPKIRSTISRMNVVITKHPDSSICLGGRDSIIIVKGIHPSDIGNISNNANPQEMNEISAKIKPKVKQTSRART